MVEGLIGKKIGMTQIFDEQGMVVPVTVIRAGPCIVVQKKSKEKDGYEALQLGLVEGERAPRVSKPMEGHFRKRGVVASRILREFSFSKEADQAIEEGDQVLVHQVFQPDDRVDVAGRVIGRGFQGVVKRHGFRGGGASHGSMFHRAPGSIGQSASPSRVFPGMKGPGRMGNNRVTIRRLKVVGIDEENHLLLVKGSIPGSRGTYLQVTRCRN